MLTVLIFLSFVLVAGVAGVVAFLAGVRSGDRLGDATVEVGRRGGGELVLAGGEEWPAVTAIVRNPGSAGVLIGLSVRRCGVRLRLEGGVRVGVPRRTNRRGLLAGRHSIIGVVAGGEDAVWAVPFPLDVRSLKLVAVIGQAGRLRVIEQRIRFAVA
jgi:hypothetical protein